MSRQPLTPLPPPQPQPQAQPAAAAAAATAAPMPESRGRGSNGRPASVRSFASSIDTLVTSPGACTAADGSYRGFASEAEYLAALREWIESKTYYECDLQIRGWYGTKTKQDYLDEAAAASAAATPSIFQERRARKRAEKREKERGRQRANVAKLEALPESEAAEHKDGGGGDDKDEGESQAPTRLSREQQPQHRTSSRADADTPVESGRPPGPLRRLTRVFSGSRRG